MADFRLYNQLFKAISLFVDFRGGQMILPYHQKIIEQISPTITTRPDGLKTAIFIIIEI